MSEWRKCTLGDVLQLQRGHDLTATERRPGTIPIIGSSGLHGFHDKALAPAPGVTVGRSGSIGGVHFVEEPFWPHNTVLYVKDFKGNDPRFVAYLLKTLPLAELNSGSAQPSLNRNFLHPLPVTVPSPFAQRRIASILGAYDDLIEVNRRRIAVLEAMARNLFEEWFVRFRFPGHEGVEIVETPDGISPKSWGIGSASDIIQFDPRTKVSPTGEKPFIDMGSLDTATSIIAGFAWRSGNSGSKFMNGDTLFARITPCLQNGKTGIVRYLPSEGGVGFGSTEFIVMRPGRAGSAFIYCLARHERFRSYAEGGMAGASGRQRARTESVASFPISIAAPDSELYDAFERAAWPMLELVGELGAANDSLAAARDLLLPRLISGELSVAVAERELEDAA